MRRYLTAAALLLALALVWDVTRNPASQVSARLLVAGIDLYQATLSRAMPAAGVVCRFEPSCSHYAEISIRRFGSVRGTWRSLVRLARCGPWTAPGTIDLP